MLTLFIYSALDGAVAKFMLVLFLKKKNLNFEGFYLKKFKGDIRNGKMVSTKVRNLMTFVNVSFLDKLTLLLEKWDFLSDIQTVYYLLK